MIGLGPIGEMATRIAQHHGVENVIGLDLVPERLARAQAHGVQTIDVSDDRRRRRAAVRELTGGRGPDAVIDAVGMEAHGAPGGALAHKLAGLMPDAVARKVMQTAGVDRLSVLNLAIELVRRGGTISLSGVYGGTADPLNMLQLFDKQITLKMGQANVRRWIDDILPLLEGDARPARRRDLRHPPRAARRGARSLREVPEEAGRRVQGGLPALTPSPSSPAPPAASAVSSRASSRSTASTSSASARRTSTSPRREGVEALHAAIDRPVDALALNAGVSKGDAFLDGRHRGAPAARRPQRPRHRAPRSAAAARDGRARERPGAVHVVDRRRDAGPFQSTYNASKSFVQSFALALRDELRGTGVSVTTLMPGPTDTNIFARAGQLGTRLGASEHKADPADVAREAFDGLMAGKERVVPGFTQPGCSWPAAVSCPTSSSPDSTDW